ncbi:MAG: hypothetical protein J5932_03630 [Prevotella sp.]|nr:hypothetical protein [Prevotella sp.]
MIRNYVALQGVVAISTRLWLRILPEWCGDCETIPAEHLEQMIDATVTFAT